LIADANSVLIGGVLYVDLTHDAGGFYNQTGLTTFELPPETRKVILKARSTQESEGLQLYIGTEVPPITYDIVTGVLTIPSVKVGTATYINVTRLTTSVATRSRCRPRLRRRHRFRRSPPMTPTPES